MENKYYVLDFGENMAFEANFVRNKLLKDSSNHVVLYLTDQEWELTLSRVEEDEFIGHYATQN